MLPEKLHKKLSDRKENNAFRQLPMAIGTNGNAPVDFSSNDYLGLAKSETVYKRAHQLLEEKGLKVNGATGSRLLSGNHPLYNEVEQILCDYHNAEASLVFNSGYDANIGFFSSVPQRGDIIFYDELIHASIRDGIQMSNAKSYRYKHNDLNDLRYHVERHAQRQEDSRSANVEIYVVTESVFSMDGDTPDLKALVDFCSKNNLQLVVDEAHAVGVFGGGLLQQLGLENDVFARIITFGKAMGCHGAAILGSNGLRGFLINFARSFIYTTALPPHSLATIMAAYEQLTVSTGVRQTADVSRSDSAQELNKNIVFFNRQLETLGLKPLFIPSNSAIHCAIIRGNENVKGLAVGLLENGFDVKPILSPTVPKGQERLRFCLHSYNTEHQIGKALEMLKKSLDDPPLRAG